MNNNNHLTPHDRFIRHMMTKPPVVEEFFMHHLPEQIKSIVDIKTIKPQPASFIDDKLKLQITDLLYSVKFGERTGYLYLLVEHLSTSQRITPFRLLKYMIAIMQRHLDQTGTDTLPIVYPMIIYAGRKKYNYSTDLFDLFAQEDRKLIKEILWKPYPLIDLTKMPDSELEYQIWCGTMLLIMKHIFDKDIAPFFNGIARQLKIIANLKDEDYIYTTLSYAVEAGEITDPEEFKKVIRNSLTKKDEESYMTLADVLRKEGREEAMRETKKMADIFRQESKQEIARNLLQQGMSIEQISRATGLSPEKISDLQN